MNGSAFTRELGFLLKKIIYITLSPSGFEERGAKSDDWAALERRRYSVATRARASRWLNNRIWRLNIGEWIAVTLR